MMYKLYLAASEHINDVYEEIHSLRARYYQMGMVFGVLPSTLDDIKEKSGRNTEHALVCVIREWLAGIGYRNRSWWEVVVAVNKKAGGNDHLLAKQIADRHPPGIDRKASSKVLG